MRILWTKSYKLNHKLGSFMIFVSHHSNDSFLGAVMHFTKKGDWSKGETIEIEAKLEQFIDTDEERVYQQCLNWINENLKGGYDIILDEYKEFEK